MKKIFGFWIFLTIIISIESVKQINRFIRGTVSQSKQQTRYNRKTLGTVSQSKHGTAEQIQQLSQLLQQ